MIIEYLKVIGTFLGGLVGIFGFIVAIVKPLRKKIINWIICNTGSGNMATQLSRMEKMLEDHISKDEDKSKDMKSLKEDFEKLKDSECCLLRAKILRIYNKYLPYGEIPMYEFEALSRAYHSYKNLGGNSFVDDIWKIVIEEWRVVPNGSQK